MYYWLQILAGNVYKNCKLLVKYLFYRRHKICDVPFDLYYYDDVRTSFPYTIELIIDNNYIIIIIIIIK